MKAPSWLIEQSLSEDLGKSGDLTTRFFVPASAKIRGCVILKADGVVCGAEIAKQVFQKVDRASKIRIIVPDGRAAKAGQKILEIKGSREILTAERIALNFLQHLSGIASLTRQFVMETHGARAKIFDTRKTLPGWRILEKYAVKCGGGENHRFGLYDMVLLKDNHWEFGSLRNGLALLKKKYPKIPVEIEADRMSRVQAALTLKPDMILLDNMNPDQIKGAILLIRASSKKIQIEISGGVNLQNVRALAQLGPDRISIGRITHSAPALDMSLEVP